MSDGAESKVGDASYDDDPLKFYLTCYQKAADHNDVLRKRVEYSRAFYEGYDKILEDRKAQKDIVRSAEFIPELPTAIQTRNSSVIDRLDGDVLPVRMQPSSDSELPEEPDLTEFNAGLRKKEEQLNRQLKESDFLSGNDDDASVFEKLFMAAELQPIAAIKVGVERVEGWVPYEKPLTPGLGEILTSLIAYQKMPEKKSITKYKYGLKRHRIYTEFLNHEEIIYDPDVICQKDMQYIIHRRWVSWNKLMEIAGQYGPEAVKKAEKLKANLGKAGSENDVNPTTAENVNAKVDGATKEPGYKDGKYRLSEFWYKYYDKTTEQISNKTMLVAGHKEILYDKVADLKTSDFPFHFKRSHWRLGCFEGRTSVEVAEVSQRIYSDLHNALMDYLSYGSLGELWVPSANWTTEMAPRRGPGAINRCTDPDKIKDIYPDVAIVQYLIPMIQEAGAKIRQQLNSPDVDQGIDPEAMAGETATKTSLRTAGSSRRQRPLMKAAADDIISVARMFIEINIQYDPSWIFPMPIEVTVPVLSGVYTPDQELQQSLLIYERATAPTNPIYAGPIGKLKLLELWKDILGKARIKDIDSRCPTEEELRMQDMILQAIEQAMAQAQGAIDGQTETNPGSAPPENEAMGVEKAPIPQEVGGA